MKRCLPLCLILTVLTAHAQSQPSPHCHQPNNLSALSPLPRPAYAHLDTITFPIDKMNKAWYRALKLRAVYLDLPPDSLQIPPFPANSSLQTRAELDYLLQIQQQRTPAMIDSARQAAGISFNPFIHPSDSNYPYYRKNLFYIGRSLGPWFNETNLPKTADLIANVWQDQLYYMWSFKFRFNRARPYALEPKINNLENTMWPAYPSGHATFAFTNAFLLQLLLPESADIIYKDAVSCARSREILGVHFPSDTEAGKILAQQLIDHFRRNKKFREDLAEAKKEINSIKPAEIRQP